MNKEFIPYEQALELKELGFNEFTFGYYEEQEGYLVIELQSLNVDIPAPLYQQAFRWFREKYNVNGYQFIYQTMDSGYALQSMEEYDQTDGYFNTYEEAELACLKKLIEIAKNK